MWTIQAALDSGVFDEIIVSSDSPAIRELAQSILVQSDSRPEALAGDRIRFVEALEEFLRRKVNVRRFDAISVLLPTCPFRNAEDLRDAHRLFLQAPERNVIAISEYDFPPQFAGDFDLKSRSFTLRHPEIYKQSTQSQSVPKSFHPCGAFYWSLTERFLQTKSFFESPLSGFLLPEERAFDIDHEYQWPLAEALAQKLLHS